MTLPGWNNFEAVKTAHHALGLAAIIFFILMVIFECIAHFGSSGKTLWNTLGIAFLALAIVCEAFAYPYSLRNEKLADGKIEGQQQIIGGLSNQLARVESQYDQATNALAVATNTVAAFESKAKPRMITPELKEKFIGLVRDAPKGKIVVQVNEGAGEEPRQFAKQINEMILAAGYESGNRSEKGGISTVFGGGDIPHGVLIGVWDATNPPPFAAPIQTALQLLDLGGDGFQTRNNIDQDTVKIWVGIKP